MFEKHKSAPADPKPAAPATSEAAVADYVIHSMPKEFYDRAAKLPAEDRNLAAVPQPRPMAPQLPPTTSLPPQPQMAPNQTGRLLPMNRGRGPVVVKPKVVAPPPPKKSYKKVILVGLALILILGAGAGVLGYFLGWFTPAPEVTPPVSVTPPAPPPVTTPSPTPEPSKPISGADTDSDGLTNVEEILYTTDFRNPDTDGDTFLDGNEVFHRYNPVGLAPSTLLDIGAVRILETVDLPFSMSYPTSWNPVNQPVAKNVSFRSDTGAVVSVVWQDKDSATSLDSWYQSQVGEVDLESLQPTFTKEGYPALIGPDERSMYIDGGTSVYTLNYELGDSGSVEFLQTFKMMANSFKLSP